MAQPRISDEQEDAQSFVKDYVERILQEVLANGDLIRKQLGRKISRIEEDLRQLRLSLTKDA
jgi:hypothetical protein